MNTAIKAGAFGAGIALAFGAAFGVGRIAGPVGAEPAPAGHRAHDDDTGRDTGDHEEGRDMSERDGTGEDDGAGGHGAGHPVPGGLQISERGYTLAPAGETFRAGERTDFRFRILGPNGEPVTRYEEAHEKELHLIVVRRDLTGYRHLHPARGADGTWSVPLTFTEAGDHRVFADFTPAGDPDGALTLGADLAVTGAYEPAPLPGPARTATVDGYTVTLEGDLTAGAAGELTLSVGRDGRPVTDLEPYLGSYGHLVALRAGDLAYLHVHPREGGPGPGIGFHAEVPSSGDYRLYLDFRHEGAVHTAEFTVRAGQPAGAAHHH
jgi:hypothetical protein